MDIVDLLLPFADTLAPDRKRKFMNLNFAIDKRRCQVVTINMPSYMHDYLIAHTWHYGLGSHFECNTGLLEGVHHAATWFLKSTCFATRSRPT